jgi:hypothetical protein
MSAAERAATLLFAVIAITVAAGVNSHSDAVAIALPPFILLLFSYMFQQYADVSVLGAARQALEEQLTDTLGGPTLIYETAVAGIRQRPPLVRSVRVLQALVTMLLVATIVVGTVIAFQNRHWYVTAGYVVFTTAGAVAAAMAFVDMLRSFQIAREELRKIFPPPTGAAGAADQAGTAPSGS